MPLDKYVIPELGFKVKDALHAIARAWNAIQNPCIKAGWKYKLEDNIQNFDLGRETNLVLDEIDNIGRLCNFSIVQE